MEPHQRPACSRPASGTLVFSHRPLVRIRFYQLSVNYNSQLVFIQHFIRLCFHICLWEPKPVGGWLNWPSPTQRYLKRLKINLKRPKKKVYEEKETLSKRKLSYASWSTRVHATESLIFTLWSRSRLPGQPVFDETLVLLLLRPQRTHSEIKHFTTNCTCTSAHWLTWPEGVSGHQVLL